MFPEVCSACDITLVKGEVDICTSCIYALPKNVILKDSPPELAKRFWGKVPVNAIHAYLKFQKGGTAQKLIYMIKYHHKKNCAVLLGRWFGADLRMAGVTFDLIVPVPLHPKKERIRGFNQSMVFGKSLGDTLQIETLDILSRKYFRTSQTNKNREERWKNVEDLYECDFPQKILGKHILLVDDVITTGATMEACVKVLLNQGASKVSLGAIAAAY